MEHRSFYSKEKYKIIYYLPEYLYQPHDVVREARHYSYATREELIEFFARVKNKDLGNDWNDCSFSTRAVK